MLFSLLIAVLWAWSLFTHPADAMHPMHKRGAAPPAVAHTYKRHLPPDAAEPGRVSAWRLRPCARSAGTSGPPAAAAAQRTHRRNKPRGGARIPQPANLRQPRELSWSALHGGGLSPPRWTNPGYQRSQRADHPYLCSPPAGGTTLRWPCRTAALRASATGVPATLCDLCRARVRTSTSRGDCLRAACVLRTCPGATWPSAAYAADVHRQHAR
jgi:hypothetical protein